MKKPKVGSIFFRVIEESQYKKTWNEMRLFTVNREKDTLDEVWFVQHSPVFTLGQAAKPEHLLIRKEIPVVKSDRGGEITYHGPGQLVVYLLLDLARRKMGIKELVSFTEGLIIDLLRDHGVRAHSVSGAPGVFVGERKIAFLGFRVRKGRTYHGFSLNVNMDLRPFSMINPCGFEGLEIADLNMLGKNPGMEVLIDDIRTMFRSTLH